MGFVMKQASFFHYFPNDGEQIQRNKRAFGKWDVSFDYEDNKVTEIHVSDMTKTPNYIEVDLSLPPRLNGIYQACEQYLSDIQTENN